MKQDAVPGITTRVKVTPNEVEHVRRDLHRALRARPLRDAGAGPSPLVRGLRRVAPGTAGRSDGRRGRRGRRAGDLQRVSAAVAATRWPTPEPTAQVGPNLDTVLEGVDADYVRTAIVDPNQEISEGFQPGVMPQDYGRADPRRRVSTRSWTICSRQPEAVADGNRDLPPPASARTARDASAAPRAPPLYGAGLAPRVVDDAALPPRSRRVPSPGRAGRSTTTRSSTSSPGSRRF